VVLGADLKVGNDEKPKDPFFALGLCTFKKQEFVTLHLCNSFYPFSN